MHLVAPEIGSIDTKFTLECAKFVAALLLNEPIYNINKTIKKMKKRKGVEEENEEEEEEEEKHREKGQ